MSWNSVGAFTPGLGPSNDGRNLSHRYKTVFSASDYSTTGAQEPFTYRGQLQHAGKQASISGFQDGRYVPTEWYRACQKLTSLEAPDFFIRVNATRQWYTRYWGSDSRDFLYPYLGFPGWEPSLKAYTSGHEIEQKARVKCMESIAQRDFDLSESLAGLLTTYRSVGNLVSDIAQSLAEFMVKDEFLRRNNIALRSRSKRAARRIAKRGIENPADRWIAWQYGWAPLINDVMTGLDFLKTEAIKGDLEMTAQGTHTEALPGNWGFSPGPRTFIPLKVLSADNKRSVRVSVRYRVNDEQARNWVRFSIENPLYTGWVATPFSFLVDWLIPVGDWLNSASSMMGTEFVDGYMTHRGQVNSEIEGNLRTLTFSGLYLSTSHPARKPKVRYELMLIKRTRLFSWPRPELYVNTSPFRSPTRLLNAVALMASLKTKGG